MLPILLVHAHFENHCLGPEHARRYHENAISKIKTEKLLNSDHQQIYYGEQEIEET